MHKTGKSAPPSFNSLDFFYCCPVKTKTRKKHKKANHNLTLMVICFFLFLTLMSCRRPDMWICFSGSPRAYQNMWICFSGSPRAYQKKEIRIAARGEERDSKTLRAFYCFCIIHRLTKIQFLDGR